MIPRRLFAAHGRSQARLNRTQGSIRNALNELDPGFSFDDLIQLIDPSYATTIREPKSLEAAHGRLVGLMAATVIIAIESDREHRK